MKIYPIIYIIRWCLRASPSVSTYMYPPKCLFLLLCGYPACVCTVYVYVLLLVCLCIWCACVGSEPDREYTVWLKGRTVAGEGDRSFPVTARTDVSGPGAPVITNITCPSDTSLVLHWRRPHLIYRWVELSAAPETAYSQSGGIALRRVVEANRHRF